jgi:hypothetical protein
MRMATNFTRIQLILIHFNRFCFVSIRPVVTVKLKKDYILQIVCAVLVTTISSPISTI